MIEMEGTSSSKRSLNEGRLCEIMETISAEAESLVVVGGGFVVVLILGAQHPLLQHIDEFKLLILGKLKLYLIWE